MRIVIGEGSCGIAAGAGKVRTAIEALLTEKEPFELGSTGCIGMCFLEPIVDLYDGKTLLRRLVRVSENDAAAIVEAGRTGDLSKVDSITISAAITQYLGIENGQTTADGLFTLEHVACLGCCSLAPVIMINGEAYGSLTPDKVVTILKEIQAKEGK
jgi:NADH:ubiquinone oxidoreductase subunit E